MNFLPPCSLAAAELPDQEDTSLVASYVYDVTLDAAYAVPAGVAWASLAKDCEGELEESEVGWDGLDVLTASGTRNWAAVRASSARGSGRRLYRHCARIRAGARRWVHLRKVTD